jgi:hypothetical protein
LFVVFVPGRHAEPVLFVQDFGSRNRIEFCAPFLEDLAAAILPLISVIVVEQSIYPEKGHENPLRNGNEAMFTIPAQWH